ncbi:GGDEF domain-containing protein [Xanthobacter flavus]|uniref:GGDEF domain-containing protein n=1 Tax=Xanthobacter flavus TaxID=281 RepID=UPI00372BDAB7
MPAATFPIVMNAVVAALFAASYLALALLHRGNTAPLWFAASFGAIVITPLALLAQSYTGWVVLFAPVIYLSFAACLILMVPGLAVLYRKPIPWGLVTVLGIVTVVSAALALQLPVNTLVRVVSYQTPFVLATAASCWVVLRDSPRRLRDLLLAGLFALLCMHVPLKAALAISLHTGPHQINYMDTPFAVVAQISTGILMVATGLLILVISVLELVRETLEVADTDALSGLLNRRGFEQRASDLVHGRTGAAPFALLLIDIDHFKAINDTFGHGVGDQTIRGFGDMLQHTLPQSALIGRVGGEEFAILLERASPEMARLQAESVRLAIIGHDDHDVPPFTVSIGVALASREEPLLATLERADAALYEAKRSGRNRVCCAEEETLPHNVVPLRR